MKSVLVVLFLGCHILCFFCGLYMALVGRFCIYTVSCFQQHNYVKALVGHFCIYTVSCFQQHNHVNVE